MNILETPNLYLRKIKADDYQSICSILQDIEVMYAWEHAFSDEEVAKWVKENIMRYRRDGYSYWAVIEKESEELIGITGLISERAENENYIGIGCIFKKEYWGKGLAYEACSACIDYGVNELNLKEITAQIRPDNLRSRNLAERLGMTVRKEFIRRYRNQDMPHLLYCIEFSGESL